MGGGREKARPGFIWRSGACLGGEENWKLAVAETGNGLETIALIARERVEAREAGRGAKRTGG